MPGCVDLRSLGTCPSTDVVCKCRSCCASTDVLVMCGNSWRFAFPHMLSSSVEFALLVQMSLYCVKAVGVMPFHICCLQVSNLRFASTDVLVKDRFPICRIGLPLEAGVSTGSVVEQNEQIRGCVEARGWLLGPASLRVWEQPRGGRCFVLSQFLCLAESPAPPNRLRFRVVGGEPVPEIRTANRDVPIENGLDIKSMADRVLSHFLESHKVIDWTDDARLAFTGFQTVLDAQCAASRDAGLEGDAALFGGGLRGHRPAWRGPLGPRDRGPGRFPWSGCSPPGRRPMRVLRRERERERERKSDARE